MKFIHCADLHLDSKMQSNLSSQKARQRNLEILDTFEKMVDFAQDNAVVGIIIAGDMFDTTRVSKQTKQRVLNKIIKNPNIDFLYLSGNHDETSFISLIEEIPSNLKIFNNQWQTYAYGNLKITGRLFDGHTNASFYDTLNLQEDNFNIVVLHGELSTQAINLNKLKDKYIDYLALGHIHSYSQEKLDERGVYCYAGCLEGRGFDECGEKGFVLLDIDANRKILHTQFINIAKRQLYEIKVNITDYDDWFAIEDQVTELVRDIAKDNLLKIVLVGKYNLELDKQLDMLTNKLGDFFYVKIQDESVLDVSIKDVEKDFSLRGEFMRRVLSSDLTDKEKEQVILIGRKALEGEHL